MLSLDALNFNTHRKQKSKSLTCFFQEFKFSSGDPYTDYMWWCVGIGLLVIALFLSARTGIYQEQMYAEHGKHPREALFYAHALPLAGFLLFYEDILSHFSIFNSSAPLILLDSNIQVPKLWAYLAGNIVTQYICIRSVYILTSECTSLTVTLVVTLRKFTSLMFSIFYFQNPFTLYHWCGTVLVFGGTLIFVELAKKIREALMPQKETKVDWLSLWWYRKRLCYILESCNMTMICAVVWWGPAEIHGRHSMFSSRGKDGLI